MTAPTVESTDLETALGHIAAERVIWLRVGAVQGTEGGWVAASVEMTSGTWPPSWEHKSWEYPAALFVGERLAGEEIAAAVRSGILKVRGFEVSLPTSYDPVRWERRQSMSGGVFEALEWPSTEAQLSVHTTNISEPHGHMLSDTNAPSFVSYYAAASYFFLLDSQPAGGRMPQGVFYRHQDRRARINRVRIADDAVEVEVGGEDLDRLLVELPGNAPGPSERIWRRPYERQPEVTRFPLKDHLPAGSWVLLRNGGEWLDRRFLAFPYARANEAGVEIVVEPGTRLESLVSSRERQHVEFKLQVPKEEQSKLKIMKTVCAFANGQGGSLLIGVDDERNIVGVDERSVDRLRDQVTQMVGSWVEPWPNGTFNVLPIADSDKVVLEYVIESGTTLYGCGRAGEARTAYVRHHGVTEKATISEITGIVRARTTGYPTPPYQWPGDVFAGK